MHGPGHPRSWLLASVHFLHVAILVTHDRSGSMIGTHGNLKTWVDSEDTRVSAPGGYAQK